MPQRVTKLRVFVASPSDVAPERKCLKGVVDELNDTLGASEKIVVELVRWETHAWPGFGEDSQSVINEQIQPYDIFVGVLWQRIGTPTGRSVSGTVEEFERAYERWRSHGRPAIMFYFNTAPFSPRPDQVEQARAVMSFKDVLQRKGALYWQYEGPDEFRDLVRRHLYQQIRAFAQSGATEVVKETPRPPISPRLEDGPAVIQAKLADAGLLAQGEGIVTLANASTQVRSPGWNTRGVSFSTLIILTNRRIIWWFLRAPTRPTDSQPPEGGPGGLSFWFLAYEQIDRVDYSNRVIDPYRPKLRVSHSLPTEPKTIRSGQLTPPENAELIARYARSRVRRY